MVWSFARRLVSLGVLLILALAWPASALAEVNGGCTAEGHSSSGSSVDITTEDVWHLKSGDIAGGSGEAPTPMSSATVGAYALGILIPIASAPAPGKDPNPQTSGSIDDVGLNTLAVLGKVFVVGARASGDGGSCDGQILVILDDVDALFTILGGGGLAAAIVGLAILLASSRGQGCLTKFVGTFGGGLAGVGLALAAEQFEIFQPTTFIGMAIAIIGALLGFIVAGRFAAGRAGSAPPPATSPRPPAPATTTPAPTPPPPPPAAAAPTIPPAAPPEGEASQDFGKFMERAETGDPETASFLEEVGGPGVVGTAPAAAPPPPPPPAASTPAASTPPKPTATTDETQGFVDGVVAPAAGEAGPPSIPFGKPPAPPTEDQKLIEGVFPGDAPTKPPAQSPDGPANDGESHPADDYGPENRPVGGGGPM